MFRDVLDLVPQSTVKVDDVTVGKVKSIKLKGYVAEVAVEIPGDLKLPENTTAQIRQTSLLGEKFVQLDRPENPGSGTAVEQRRDRARPHRAQPRGRRGLRCARAAAQRRWRRSAQDHRLRAQQRLHRARGRGALGPDPDPHLHGPARREQGVDRRRAREHQPPGGGDPQAGRHHQERAGRHPRRPALGQPAARRPGQAAQGPDPAQRRRRPGDPGVQGVHDQQPARPRAGARGLRQGRGELPEVLPGVPDLPVRRRGRRPRPAGGPQPAHG